MFLAGIQGTYTDFYMDNFCQVLKFFFFGVAFADYTGI